MQPMNGCPHCGCELDEDERGIDPLSDELIKLLDVPALLPVSVHLRTMYEWERVGIGGVRLETVKVGRIHYTTKAALRRFFRRQSMLEEFNSPTAEIDIEAELQAVGLHADASMERRLGDIVEASRCGS